MLFNSVSIDVAKICILATKMLKYSRFPLFQSKCILPSKKHSLLFLNLSDFRRQTTHFSPTLSLLIMQKLFGWLFPSPTVTIPLPSLTAASASRGCFLFHWVLLFNCELHSVVAACTALYDKSSLLYSQIPNFSRFITRAQN